MKYITLAAAGLLAASPALAGNLNPAPSEPMPMQPITPVMASTDWTGAYVGAQLGYGDFSAEGTATEEGDGAVGGVHAGYQYDFGSYVLGGELNLNTADIDADSGAATFDNLHELKFKAGYDAGKTLIYGTAGAAYADATVAGTEFSDTGYLVGAGVDYMLSDNVVLGGEVTYHQFDDFDDSGIDLDATTVNAKVSYKF